MDWSWTIWVTGFVIGILAGRIWEKWASGRMDVEEMYYMAGYERGAEDAGGCWWPNTWPPTSNGRTAWLVRRGAASRRNDG